MSTGLDPMMELILCALIVGLIILVIRKYFGGSMKNTSLGGCESKLLKTFGVHHVSAIADRFTCLDDVTTALRQAGLESSNLIFGVDFTQSNLYQGEKTFGGRSLHATGPGFKNPYQQVIEILGKTLESFDEDHLIPCFGFGDASVRDKGVFPFKAEGFCHGFGDALEAYTALTQRATLSGPTNFAPLIYQAIDIVKMTRQYHILIIVADGQVTSERPTRDAIVAASSWPLSIVMVGVGDGPWDCMRQFDDGLPERRFDNFQFVDFHSVLSQGPHPEASFALHALMEIPDQFMAIRQMGLLDF